jgi:RNase H-fold protein (predicted Holliday junction resolvase)
LHFVDERFTTRSVEAWRREAGVKKGKLREGIDAGAAAAILQTFLDRRQPAAPESQD